MSKIIKGLYPDNINTPNEMIEYLESVYGIDEDSNKLLRVTIAKICSLAINSEYTGWFEDYYHEEFLSKKI